MIQNQVFRPTQGGVRLDAALFDRFPTSSRSFIKAALNSGDIWLQVQDGEIRHISKGYRLHGNETIVIRSLLEREDNLVLPENGELNVVFEDESILAIDKPATMPVQPLSCRETGTLMNRVVAQYPECRPIGDIPLMAGALHRIDADTSGLVLIARKQTTFNNLRAQFVSQTVKKTYLALVEGDVAVGGTLINDLAHDPTLPFCKMIDAHHNRLTRENAAKLKHLHAETTFNPIGRTISGNEERTLLEVVIHTGVTHQIRAQLAIAGMHIVNDRLYGAFAIENMHGHCLHALRAEFIHPDSNNPVCIQTGFPDWAKV